MSTSQDRHDHQRYEIVGEQRVTVTIDPEDRQGRRRVFDARLINLSSGGARFAVPATIPVGEVMHVQLAIERLGLSMYVTAEVCWAENVAHGESLLGCKLAPAVPAGLLRKVAEGGRTDRRHTRRSSTSCEVAIKRNGGGWWNGVKTAVLCNVAEGGVCMETRKPLTLGEQIRIIAPETGDEVEVVVRWQVANGSSHLSGCEFADAGRATEFEAVLTAAAGKA